MVVPFAYYFGVRPWEMDLLEHADFLALEAAARELAKGGADGG